MNPRMWLGKAQVEDKPGKGLGIKEEGQNR